MPVLLLADEGVLRNKPFTLFTALLPMLQLIAASGCGSPMGSRCGELNTDFSLDTKCNSRNENIPKSTAETLLGPFCAAAPVAGPTWEVT